MLEYIPYMDPMGLSKWLVTLITTFLFAQSYQDPLNWDL
jgi:hypothetical protein